MEIFERNRSDWDRDRDRDMNRDRDRDCDRDGGRDRDRCPCGEELDDLKKALNVICCQLDRIAGALENDRNHHCR